MELGWNLATAESRPFRVMGIGSDAWDRRSGPRDRRIHSFREIGQGRAMQFRAGDFVPYRAKAGGHLLRAAAQIMQASDAVSGLIELKSPKVRLLRCPRPHGLVDGNENPRGEAVIDAALSARRIPPSPVGSM